MCLRQVFLSSLCSLPAIVCAYAPTEYIAIPTANGDTLNPMEVTYPLLTAAPLLCDSPVCGAEEHH